MNKLSNYLIDPFLKKIYAQIRKAGAIRSISVDLTNQCNLRCTGCYYFEEGMDGINPGNERQFDLFLESEKERGTNFITVVGGEPSLKQGRLKKIYDKFKMNVATNGLIKITSEGLENMPIGVSVWGMNKSDSVLRSNGVDDLFSKALKNYKHDPRAFWYYTVAPGLIHEIPEVVDKCIENGNRVLFNYYSDITKSGGILDHRKGLEKVAESIEQQIEKYPGKILTNSYLNQVVTTGKLLNETWGYEVCTNISSDHQVNRERIANGNIYNTHFRAYNADFETTRRCCTGISRSCSSCFDTWEHFSWIMINMKKHLESEELFIHWLTTMYLFYLLNKIIDTGDFESELIEIHSHINKHKNVPIIN